MSNHPVGDANNITLDNYCLSACSDRWGFNCQNVCGCSPNVVACDPVDGCVTCKNPDAWEGYNCQTNIDECQNDTINSTCPSNSTCKDMPGSWTCQCDAGYTKRDSNIPTSVCDGMYRYFNILRHVCRYEIFKCGVV